MGTKAGPRSRDFSRGVHTITDTYSNLSNDVIDNLKPTYFIEFSCQGYWVKPRVASLLKTNINGGSNLVSTVGGDNFLLDDSGTYWDYWFKPSFLVAQADKYISELRDSLESGTSSELVEVDFVTDFHISTMHDVVTPNWKELAKQGKFTFSPMSKETFEGRAEHVLHASKGSSSVDFSYATPYQKKVNVSKNLYGIAYIKPAITQSSKPSIAGFTQDDIMLVKDDLRRRFIADRAKCTDIANSKSKSDFTAADLDALISIAEAPDTIKTFLKLANKAHAIYKSAKDGTWRRYAPKLWRRLKRHKVDPSQYARTIDGMSDIWLEMRYAIRPIIYDIIGIMKVLDGSEPLTEHQSYNGFHSENFDEVDTPVLYSDGSATDMMLTHYSETTGKAGILAELVNDDPGLKKKLGLTNFGSLIWDKITFSFVAGWFVDVGQLLYDMNPSVVYREKGSWVTTRTSCTFEVAREYASGESTNIVLLKGIYDFTERIIAPESRYFTLETKLNALKITDLLALTKDLWLSQARK